MKRELAKVLRKRFDQQLKQAFPSFQPVKEDVPAGDRRYRWAMSSDLFAFLDLNISQRSEEFTLELGWSTDGKYPWHDDVVMLTDDVVRRPSCRFRLSELLLGEDFWWKIGRWPTPQEIAASAPSGKADNLTPEERRSIWIDMQIQNALQQFERHGLPFLHQVETEAQRRLAARAGT